MIKLIDNEIKFILFILVPIILGFCIVSAISAGRSIRIPVGSIQKQFLMMIEMELIDRYSANGEFPKTKEEVVEIVKGKIEEEDYLDDLIYIGSDSYESNALSLKKEDGTFYNIKTFQLRLFGKNGADDRGYGDDLQNFKP